MEPPYTFDDIYQQYHTQVISFIRRMVGPEDAEDTAQEVFAKINRGLKRFEGRSRLSTWIFRIATNTALDRLRSRKTMPAESPFTEETEVNPGQETIKNPVLNSSPLQQVIHTEMNDCIREQVDKLPEKYRTVMILSSLEELNNPEITEILDISVENVKIRLHRARAMLKKILETQCSFYRNPLTGALACDRKSNRSW